MKEKTHPEYVVCEVTCGCGERFVTRSTSPTIKVEVCSKCHPFYTGTQKLMDSAGRVESFQRKWGKHIEKRKADLAAKKPESSTEKAPGGQ